MYSLFSVPKRFLILAFIVLFSLPSSLALATLHSSGQTGSINTLRPVTRTLPKGRWGYVGDLQAMVGANVFNQGQIVAFCSKDDDHGPGYKGLETVKYTDIITVRAGEKYIPNTATARGDTAGQVVAAKDTGAIAVLTALGTASAKKMDRSETMAIHYAINGLSATGNYTEQETISQSIKNRAATLIKYAYGVAGPYRNSGFEIAVEQDAEQGYVTGVGVQGATGNWISAQSYTLELVGPATFLDGTKTMSAKTSNSAQSIPIKIIDSGNLSAVLKINNLPPSTVKMYRHLVSQDVFVTGEPTTFSLRTTAKEVSLGFQPIIETNVVKNKLEIGDTLVDSVTLKAGKGKWPTHADGTPVPIKVQLDAYGYFSVPRMPSKGGADFSQYKIGRYNLTFTKPGTQNTPATIKMKKAGFVFLQAKVVPAAQESAYQKRIKEFTSSFFEPSETALVTWKPEIQTSAQRVKLADGKYGIKDAVTVTGFPQDHSDFAGLGKWQKDVPTIQNELFFIPRQLEHKAGVTEKLVPLAKYEIPAKNGKYEIPAEKFRMDPDLGAGTYQIVSHFAGDERATKIHTSDMDTTEQAIPEWGTVKTQVKHENNKAYAGAPIWDEISVNGTFPSNSYTRAELFFWKKDTKPICEKAIWESEPITHSGKAGIYNSNKFITPANKPGIYGFVESTYDRFGNLLTQGKCGDVKETVVVGRTPVPLAPQPKITPNDAPKESQPTTADIFAESQAELAVTGASLFDYLLLALVLAGVGIALFTVVLIWQRK